MKRNWIIVLVVGLLLTGCTAGKRYYGIGARYGKDTVMPFIVNHVESKESVDETKMSGLNLVLAEEIGRWRHGIEGLIEKHSFRGDQSGDFMLFGADLFLTYDIFQFHDSAIFGGGGAGLAYAPDIGEHPLIDDSTCIGLFDFRFGYRKKWYDTELVFEYKMQHASDPFSSHDAGDNKDVFEVRFEIPF